jgi:hypothetical protein
MDIKSMQIVLEYRLATFKDLGEKNAKYHSDSGDDYFLGKQQAYKLAAESIQRYFR